MSASNQAIHQLIAAARKAYKPLPPTAQEAPFGFSTRVAARWAEARKHTGRGDVWERFCWWGAGASVAVCLAAFAHQALTPEPDPFDLLLEVQAVGAEVP